jgi:hypothetical protein
MEGDIRRCWSAMRRVTKSMGEVKVPVTEVTKELENILLETFGSIPDGYDVESKITSFVAGLFLTHRGYAWISQEGPDDPIMLEDRWPNASTFDDVTILADKLMEEDSDSIKADETESMRHASRLAERAKSALEEAARAKLEAEADSENPAGWLVE